MPIKKTTKNGKPAYQWGGHGKVYTGKDAHTKAVKQMQAAFARGYRGKTGK